MESNDYDDFEMYGGDSPSGPNVHQYELHNGEQIQFGGFGFPGVLRGEESPAPSSPGGSDTDPEIDNQPLNFLEEILDPLPSPPPPPEYAARSSSESQIFEKVFHCLNDRQNLLIECPPTMGRKLSIAKPVLNFWQWKKNDMDFPLINKAHDFFNRENAPDPARIYIGTRGFLESQLILKQLKDELGTTQLLWKIQMSVLDHRQNFCINEAVTGSANINHDCRKLILQRNQSIPSSSKKSRQDSDHNCEYYQLSGEGALPFVLQDGNGACGRQQDIYDIEDFMLHCHQSTRCPYYDGIRLAQDAHLIICPVEFLLNPVLRDEYSIKLDRSIVFIDDGYDLENLCKKEATIDMTVDDLNKASSLMRALSVDYQVHHEEAIGLAELGEFLPMLSQWVTDNVTNRPDRADILEFFNRLNVNALNIPLVMKAILEYAENSAPAIPDYEASVIEKLRKFVFILELLFEKTDSFYVKVTTRESLINNNPDTVLLILCADPSLLLKPVASAATSLIVGSNVIAPYSPFYTEFDVVFEETLKLDLDPIQNERLHIVYTSKGDTGVKLALDFDSRNDPEVKKETGCTVLKICKTVPYGKIVLFHSKDYLRKTLDFWQKNKLDPDGNNTIMDDIRITTFSSENVYCELDMTTDAITQRLMNGFQRSAREKNGAVLFALHRGKLYQDWSLKYDSVRTIVHISLPFGPWYTGDDIIGKRKFLERKYNERDCLQNKDWYHKEAFRKLNQSFCYTMQEKKEWGVVIVLDARMHGERHEFDDTLPEWVARPQFHQEFSTLIRSVEDKVRQCTNAGDSS